ncbi:hypothetical protein AB3X96_12280 [Paraburkholderia sp. BR13439]|uniref:hypothetical protein n=1 Tax=Paraburkholderia TaxID=1822464 RepID=UPI0034CF979C
MVVPRGAVGSTPRHSAGQPSKNNAAHRKIRCAAFFLGKAFSKLGLLISQSKNPF